MIRTFRFFKNHKDTFSKLNGLVEFSYRFIRRFRAQRSQTELLLF